MRMLIQLLAYGCLFALTSCGGGGGSSNSNVAGIDGSGNKVASVTGSINGFGSVIVNGIKFNSDKSKILINGELSTEDNLYTGFQVKVTGIQNNDGTGVADSIEFYPNIVGNITQIDMQNEQLHILGQTIQVSNTTLFDETISPNNISGLSIGARILVSGLPDSNGQINATRINIATQASHQVSGIISNLDESTATFSLNQLSINYKAAAFSDVENNHLTSNMRVLVAGSLNGETFIATNIRQLKTTFDKDIKEAEVEGIISRFISSTDYDIAGIKCTTNVQTQYENGNQAQLGLGVRLKIKGALTTDKIVLAQKIVFSAKVNQVIAGEVSAVALSGSGAIASGTLQINGITIKTTVNTNYQDSGNGKLKRFNFNSITAGNFLKVSGYNGAEGFIATKIERAEIKTETESDLNYEGTVTSVETHSVKVFGRNILINAQTEIRDISGEPLTEVVFIATAVSQNVKVRGILKNGVFIATRIEVISKED
jgi:hypothetical protein